VAVFRQARLLLAAGIALGAVGCGHDGPEDPAVAVPGEGIPMGAASAHGVGFDPPPVTRPTESGKGKPPVMDPDETPPDPFADPPALPPGSATPPPHHHPKPSKGMSL
jgi:hypothetical protein